MRVLLPLTAALLAGLIGLCGLEANACPVCYGEHNDAPIFQGAEAAMLFLLGFTYTLISSGTVGWLLLRRKQRRELEASGPP